MHKRENVSGLFFIGMEVVDQSGKPVASINATTSGARHVVSIENISTLPRNVRVVAVLPQGLTRIAFTIDGGYVDRWQKEMIHIPDGQIRTLECDLVRTRGPNATGEPIQCDEVYDQRGTLQWKKLTKGLPFQITIDAV